ncbi:MAG TPA: helix-turn-helix domain-containing protein [Patescibacteria group bacterium]|nr:helix-turn-helix domain-containing protein [Patescibacteria group bacterium]
MTHFIPKKIGVQVRLGEELRRARNDTNLNIEDVSKMTQIRKEYLLALESEDFNILPSGLYGRNYLKKYANFLKIPPNRIEDFLKQLELEYLNENPFSKKILNKRKFIIFPKLVRNTIVILAVFACFLYLILYFKNIVVAPDLEIYQPNQNIMTSETVIEVVGKTQPGSELSINEEAVLTDNEGNFVKLINLKKGLNTLEISVKKKYSRVNTIIRQVLVE